VTILLLLTVLAQRWPTLAGSATLAAGGVHRAGGRFANSEAAPARISLGEMARFWIGRIRVSLRPRPGAAQRVPFDPASLTDRPTLTWIGHSTLLVRMESVAFLTDPMFSGRAGPGGPVGPPRLVPPGIALASLPPVRFALLSHDHYDHADVESVRALAARGVRFLVPLGLGDWVRQAGGQATELDWWQEVEIDGLRIHCVPAQHFSGRSLRDTGRRLWAGWVVAGPTRRFYYAGDTGYSPELAAIGERLGPFDLAAVPIGAYRPAEIMRVVHTTPEEALRLATELGARRVVGVHYGTFDLADEPLDEPPHRFRAEADRRGLSPERAWLLKVGETREW
jgi:N-acyl-phosphatidylethanolamine-hydrolysing phospholipase D